MRVNAVGQGEDGAQVALELRDGLDLGQNLRIHSFLISLTLLCNLVFLNKEKSVFRNL